MRNFNTSFNHLRDFRPMESGMQIFKLAGIEM